MKMIDLRSDTVTKPSRPMLEAMVKAEVGDDVFGEDPTVNLLQDRIADMFRKEASLFVPSGTMGNEVCIKVHTQPGDEIIVEQESHIFVYETGAPVLLSGVQMNTLPGTRGIITADQIAQAIRPKAYYLPPTKLICLENTHGRSAGSILPFEEIRKIRTLALGQKIAMHLDGARLWNACAATGIQPHEYAALFDSLSVCFSKGLGAPVGSILMGTSEFVEQARRYRKIFGGGMRQAGILAAAALYALDHNIGRLKEDHAKAAYLAAQLQTLRGLHIDASLVQTNMVFIDISQTGKNQSEVIGLLREHGILVTPERRESIRAVMHLDLSMDDVREAATVFQKLFA